MPGVARLNDSIQGMTSGEHSGHSTPHPPSPITGTISGNCSPNVFVNGLPAAYVGSITTEHDDCCGTNSGSVAEGSSTVFCNGNPLSRMGDAINPHNGTASITGGSSDVFCN